MSRSEREFLRVLAQAEGEMNTLFAQLAHDVGDVVLRSAGPDGVVPVERLREVQAAARRLVDQALLGPAGRPFSDSNDPQSAYARAIANGQIAMIDQVLERQARLLDRHLPADVRDGLRERYTRGTS